VDVSLDPAVQGFNEIGVLYRTAVCPVHKVSTRLFRGVVSEGWVFKCKRGGEGGFHLFAAPADPSAPKTLQEAREAIGRDRRRRNHA